MDKERTDGGEDRGMEARQIHEWVNEWKEKASEIRKYAERNRKVREQERDRERKKTSSLKTYCSMT